MKRNGSPPGKRKQKSPEIEQLASNPATDAVRVEQLLRAMRSIAELADAALRDDHRLLYFAQLARQVEIAATPAEGRRAPERGEGRAVEGRPPVLIRLEAPPGFEPGNKGFADPCLTTWRRSRRRRPL